MKKIFLRTTNTATLILAVTLLFLSLCSCGSKPDITIEEIIAANRASALLENYDSFLGNIETVNGDYSSGYYIDKEYRSYFDASTVELAGADIECAFYYISEDAPEGFFFETLNATGERFALSIQEEWALDDIYTAKEVITECERKGDKLFIKAQMPTEYTLEYFGEMAELNEDDCLLVEYELNAETYAILKSTECFIGTDGSIKDFATLSIEYNAERPEAVQKLLAKAKQENDVITITLVIDPGTEKERSCSQIIPKDGYIQFWTPEGYDQCYTDAECTEILEVYPDSDTTIYTKFEETPQN